MWETKVHNVTTNAKSIAGSFKSNKPLNIKSVDGSCGCSVTKLDHNGFGYSISLVPVKDHIAKELYNMGQRSYNKEVNFHVYYEDDTPVDRFVVKIQVNE